MNNLKRSQFIKWHTSKKCSVMIFDTEGADILMHCIPLDFKLNILNIREGIPLLSSPLFFLYLIRNIVKYKKIVIALFVTIVQIWNPRAILSYIDNSRYLGYLQEQFPEITVISIQNGFRGDFSDNKMQFSAGTYFSFGEMESDLFLCNNYKYREMYPIGSLRAGLVHEIENKKETFDICFISEYPSASDLKHAKSWDSDLLEVISKAETQLFDLAVKFAANNKLNLCVAMRSGIGGVNYEEEKNFFISRSNSELALFPRNNLSSYEVALASHLVICLFSTLGYEMLGLGKKIIFSADYKCIKDFFMRGSWSINYPTYKLPSSQRIFKMEYSEFSSKAKNLINMKSEDYIESSKIARNYYMNINLNNKPHEIVKSYLLKIL